MLLYAVTKFVAYCLWCLLGLRLLAPARATLLSSIKFGSLRWLLGLGFGLLAALALGSISRESVAALYLGIYAPLRVVEWAIMAVLIQRISPSDATPLRSPRVWLWVAGGIAVSFLSDLASPEGMAGRFCVGRCLC
jgi:hypothetical protein